MDAAIDADGGLHLWGTIMAPRREMRDHRVTTPGRVIDVSRDEHELCIVVEDGRVYCWQVLGARASARRPSPEWELIRELPPAHDVECAHQWCCAVTNDDRLFCWGRAYEWIMDRPASRWTVAEETLRDPIRQLALGRTHLCYERDTPSRDIYCWAIEPEALGLVGPPLTPIRVPVPPYGP